MPGKILVERGPDDGRLKTLGVGKWPVWAKETSEFPWSYEETETCYILEGQVTVTTDSGEAFSFGKGDLVTFPKGLSCIWRIHQDVKKHYRFG
ncbi:MAG TPA: cupin domain-containing protein [bacterium]